MSVLRLSLMLSILAIGLTACGAPSPSNVPTEATTAAVQPTPLPPIVARVDGVEITREAFEAERARLTLPGTPPDPALDDAIIDGLIEQVILEQAAADLGVTVSDDDLDYEMSLMQTQSEQAAPGGWQAWLDANGYTEAELREAVGRSLLVSRVRTAVLTEQEIGETIPAVRARHILLESEAEAESIRERLEAGEPFEQLAAQYSRDVSTKDSGGDLGYFVRDDLTTPELAELAFALQPGQMAGPVQTILGWHIVETLAFEERPVTDENLALAQEQAFSAWLAERKAQATIERF